MKETKLAGANYIISFFNDIQNLNHHYSMYCNMLIEVNAKHGINSIEGLEEYEKNTLIKVSQDLRYYVNKCYIAYVSIHESLEITKSEEIPIVYPKLMNRFIIIREDIEKFVTEINVVLVKKIIRDLLQTSQDIFNDVYGTQTA